MATRKHAIPMQAKVGISARVGRKIRGFRVEKGWSQQMLADHAEVERGHLARLELGQAEPCVIILEKIAIALGVETAELLR